MPAIFHVLLAARAEGGDSPIGGSGDMSQEVRDAVDRINSFGPYGYQPSLAGSVVFCVVYGLCTIALLYQSVRGRRWWMLATLCFSAFCETVGNGLRIYGHFHSDVVNPYIAQQVILVLTPAFFAAAHFTILTKIAELYGARYIKPVRSSWLIPFFVVLDVASLAVQGAGSGQAAIAEIDGEPVSSVNSKGNIVVAGLAIQLFAYVAFNVLFLTFVARAFNDSKRGQAPWLDGRVKLFLGAVYASALLVLGRSAFRTAEMGIGWIGEVATTEWYYLVFDATFVALSVIILIVVSPASYLPRVSSKKERAGNADAEAEAVDHVHSEQTTFDGHVSVEKA